MEARKKKCFPEEKYGSTEVYELPTNPQFIQWTVKIINKQLTYSIVNTMNQVVLRNRKIANIDNIRYYNVITED